MLDILGQGAVDGFHPGLAFADAHGHDLGDVQPVDFA